MKPKVILANSSGYQMFDNSHFSIHIKTINCLTINKFTDKLDLDIHTFIKRFYYLFIKSVHKYQARNCMKCRQVLRRLIAPCRFRHTIHLK